MNANSALWQPSHAQQSHINRLMAELSLPVSGQTFVSDAVTKGPSRQPDNRFGNSLLKHTSQKNNRVQALESRTGEYAMAVLLERDEDVIAYFCQPPQQLLSIANEEGKVVTKTNYTPDFLVARGDRFVVIEVRDEAKLMQHALKNPHQFYRDPSSDEWHYRAAEDHFRSMGLDYQLIANRQINSVLVNNIRFLEDFLLEGCQSPDPLVLQRLLDFVEAHKRVSHEMALEAGFSADEVLFAVANGLVYTDLERDRIDLAATRHVYSSKAARKVFHLSDAEAAEEIQPIPGTMLLRPGTRVTMGQDIYYVVLCGERDVELRGERGPVTVAIKVLEDMLAKQAITVDGMTASADNAELAMYSDMQISNALERLRALDEWDLSRYSSRSLERFRMKTKHCNTHIGRVLALVDESAAKGNRTPRFTERDEEAIQLAIESKYNTPEAPTKMAAYLHYLSLCEAKDRESQGGPAINRVSQTTFIRRLSQAENVRKREGKRQAYQKGKIVSSVSNLYPVHGVMPHEVCYIDHTVLNLATVSSDGSSMPLGKPTFSVAIDGCTSQARAMILLYDPPSATTVLMVLRDYVRRNRRLPKILSIDNGKEFRGTQLQAFCQLYGIDLRFRAPGMPRGSAPIESLMGNIEDEVLCHMTGNTIQMKNPRNTTRAVNGFHRAGHSLTGAYKVLESYLFQEREHRIHPTLGVTPGDYEAQLVRDCGERQHMCVLYDRNLMLATSPFAKRVWHKVCPRRGVWVDGRWYRHSALRNLPKQERVRVRIEPFAARVVYVEVKKRWHAAIGTNSRDLDGRTHREVEIAAREKSKRAPTNSRKDRIQQASMRFQPKSFAPEDFDPLLGERQAEQKRLLAQSNLLGAMEPDEIDATEGVPFDFARAPVSSPIRPTGGVEPKRLEEVLEEQRKDAERQAALVLITEAEEAKASTTQQMPTSAAAIEASNYFH